MWETSVKKTVIFNFRDSQRYADYPQFNSIGWEIRTKAPEYNHNCEHVKERHCLFQYTLAGEGRLSIHNMDYRLTPGKAFMLEKPGPYRYWLPEDSPGWEFIFLSFSHECLPYWNNLIDVHGHTAEIPLGAPILRMWKRLYDATVQNRMNCFLQSSSLAYQFIMELTRFLNERTQLVKRQSIVQRCLIEIRQHYNSPLNLSHLAQACAVSPAYLSRVFHEQMAESPLQYMQRYRLTLACSLLLRSSFPIRTIAEKVGFHDANYFTRVFRKHLHLTPQEYRQRQNAEDLLQASGVNRHIDVQVFSC